MTESRANQVWRAYRFPIVLLSSVVGGSLLGLVYGKDVAFLKPLGDIFINMIFQVIVPVVFFSISASVASMSNLRRLGKILGSMLLVFVITGAIAATMMIVLCELMPPAQGMQLALPEAMEAPTPLPFSEQVVKSLTTSDFPELISRKNMLPLILFSIFFGFVVGSFGEKAKRLVAMLDLLSEVCMKMIQYLMYYAPIGLFAYFAYLIGDMGPQLLGTYARTMLLMYYPLCLFYFIFGFGIYAWIAGGFEGVRRFFRYIPAAAATALGTQSSIATLPVNLQAAKNIGVPKDIRDIVLPIGATAHMDGTCFSTILKVALMFGLFGMPFSGIGTWLSAIAAAIVCGVVMSGVPGGGLIGEVLIMSLYGFPMEYFPIIATIGFLVDPPATVINSNGDTVVAMIVTRMVEGKDWMARNLTAQEEELEARGG